MLQDFLVEQPGLQDIDLVSEVYALLAHLEPEIDGSTIHIVHQCVDALTEFVQGNISRLGPNHTPTLPLPLHYPYPYPYR